MNLYFISRKAHIDWNTYSSFVVAAANRDEAMNTHPDGESRYVDGEGWLCNGYDAGEWPIKPREVECVLIGIAEPTSVSCPVVICASYHAG